MKQPKLWQFSKYREPEFKPFEQIKKRKKQNGGVFYRSTIQLGQILQLSAARLPQEELQLDDHNTSTRYLGRRKPRGRWRSRTIYGELAVERVFLGCGLLVLGLVWVFLVFWFWGLVRFGGFMLFVLPCLSSPGIPYRVDVRDQSKNPDSWCAKVTTRLPRQAGWVCLRLFFSLS